MTTAMTWSDETRQAVAAACRCVRETPIGDGRKVWNLLTDDRSRRAVEIAERYVAGEATYKEMSAAAWAASDAAWDTSDVAAGAAAAAAWAAASAAAAIDEWGATWAAARAVTYAAHAAAAARMAATRKIVAAP